MTVIITSEPSIILDDSFCELVSVPHNCSENMSLMDNSDVKESKNGIKSEFGYKYMYSKKLNHTIRCKKVHYINKPSDSIVYLTRKNYITSSYATWFTAGGAIRIAHYDVIDEVIIRKL